MAGTKYEAASAQGEDSNRSGLVSRPSEIEFTALRVVGPPLRRTCSSDDGRGQAVTLGVRLMQRALDLRVGPRLRHDRSEESRQTDHEGPGSHCDNRFGDGELDHGEP